MIFRFNPSTGVPVYLQIVEQVKHAVDLGALRPGDQLPPLRRVAEDLVINPNTVARAYRDLEQEGVIELRQGRGAFVAGPGRGSRVRRMQAALPDVRDVLERLVESGLTVDEIRRLVEAELQRLGERPRARNA